MEDVFILCRMQYAHSIADAFVTQFQDSQTRATVLAHGCTMKPTTQTMGYIVIEWEDSVPGEFIHQLEIDQDITNFAIYKVPTYYDSPT